MDPSSSGGPVASGAPPPPRPASRRHRGWLAGVLLLGLFAYSSSLHGPFVFDDRHEIRDNPLVRDLAGLLTGPGYDAQPSRFVAYVTFALNYRLGGLDVVGYHAVNLAIHLACALLVYALVALTFRTPRLRASSLAPSGRAIAFAAAALFVTHPVQTQAVTYVVQRITSLATLLYVLAVVLYARWRLAREADGWPRRRAAPLYVLALLAAIAAMKTKEIAFTLPFAIVLYELSFFDRTARPWRALAPFLATALVVPATLLRLHGGAGAGVGAAAAASTRAQSALSRLDYLRTELTVVVEYLRLLVLPTGQNLDHDHPIYRSFLAPRVLASLLLLGALAAAAGWLYRRTRRPDPAVDPAARLVAFGVAWFFLALLVESSVIPIDDVMNEHRVYLPSVGLLAGLAAGGALLLRRVPRVDPARLVALVALLLAIPLAVATLWRNAVWASDVSLWADAASKSPDKARPFGNLAVALAAAGRPEEGIRALRRAVRLAPEDPIVRGQLGAALASRRHFEEAEVEIREAIRLDPARPEPVHNLALLLASTGRVEEAKGWYRRYRELAPNPAAALDRRGLR